ncbi:MAG: RNA-binding S4 domain-containing protein [Synergistaceae bacterium]|jgi:ribosomal 50S subunit-recycling heat shock protein|nr:RNA-binding S4 domain-containing protein [Synergistaceae bacterium]
MRIDRFLKLSRLVKRRAAAAEMVDVGAVRLNGRTVRPAAGVKPGDAIEIAFPRRMLSVEVITDDETALKRGAVSFRVTSDRPLTTDERPW